MQEPRQNHPPLNKPDGLDSDTDRPRVRTARRSDFRPNDQAASRRKRDHGIIRRGKSPAHGRGRCLQLKIPRIGVIIDQSYLNSAVMFTQWKNCLLGRRPTMAALTTMPIMVTPGGEQQKWRAQIDLGLIRRRYIRRSSIGCRRRPKIRQEARPHQSFYEVALIEPQFHPPVRLNGTEREAVEPQTPRIAERGAPVLIVRSDYRLPDQE
jgi:hypothetical protein